MAEYLIVKADVEPERHPVDDRVSVLVGFPFVQKLLGVLAVQVKPFGLTVRPEVSADVGALVPVKVHPLHTRHYGLFVLGGGPFPVGVLNPKDKRAAAVTGPQPVEKSRVGAADVKRSGRTGGKTNSHRVVHGRKILLVNHFHSIYNQWL